jgi:copper transporter 1
MGHGGMDHGGMDHGNMCNMNVSLSSTSPLCPHLCRRHTSSRKLMPEAKQMLFTWDTQNLCIVFKSWRVTSTMSLLWSLLGVMLLTAGYELIREISRRYEAKVQREIDDMPSKFFFPLLPFLPISNFSAVYTLLCFALLRDLERINIAKMA